MPEDDQYTRPWRQGFGHEIRYLPLKAMKIQCLDSERKEINGAYGSGFVVVEDQISYLYTCWHVVTGFGFEPIRVKPNHITRCFLRVSTRLNNGSSISGEEKQFDVPLYQDDKQNQPLWEQSPFVRKHPTINAANLAVPRSLDVARVKIPEDVKLSFLQVFYSEDFDDKSRALGVCDEVFAAGYPYGYSALPSSPSAIVQPRRVASEATFNRDMFAIIDRPCASGMSGSPVVMNVGGFLQVVGEYSGLIYPDFAIGENTPHTALGRVEDLFYLRMGVMKFASACLSVDEK